MKFNRNKTGLVVIVMVLAVALILSGCTTASGGKAPDFLEVGDYYVATESATGGGGAHLVFKLLEIGYDGWILIEEGGEQTSWVNTAQLARIEKGEKPE